VLFRVSVTGSAQQTWDYTAPPVVSGTCERTVRSEGIRRVAFRTTSPTVLRVAGGRFAAADLRALAGTVSLGGALTTDERCGDEGTSRVADCAPSKRSFARAQAHVTSPRAGALVVQSVHNVRLRRATCPTEPAEVPRAPLGPLPVPLRVSTRTLANRELVRITLRSSKTRTTRYGSPAAGNLRERTEWTVTLVRLTS
jgi:hypothetical protein